jgi:hypothetical protein
MGAINWQLWLQLGFCLLTLVRQVEGATRRDGLGVAGATEQ